MVDTVYWLPIGGPAAPADWLGAKGGGHLVPFLYSSCEPSELSQWLCHDDSTINVVVVIIIIASLNGIISAKFEASLTISYHYGKLLLPVCRDFDVIF